MQSVSILRQPFSRIGLGVLTLLLAMPIAGAQGLASSSGGSLKALAKVEAEVDQVTRVLDEIKLDELNVRYREGKFVEGNRSRALRYAALVRKQGAAYRRLQTLQGLFALSGALSGLERETDAVSSGLMRLASELSGEAATKPLNWSVRLDQPIDMLHKASIAFDEEVLDILARADDLLARSPRAP